jgi:hypothetical protein
VLVIFTAVDDEGNAGNILEWHKIM